MKFSYIAFCAALVTAAPTTRRETAVDLGGVDLGIKRRETAVDLGGVDLGIKREAPVLPVISPIEIKRETAVDLGGVDLGIKRDAPKLANVDIKVPSPGIDLPLPETNVGAATGLADITKPITNSLPVDLSVEALN
jgi:hypothetical protein